MFLSKTNFFSHPTTRLPTRVPAHPFTGPSSFPSAAGQEIEAEEETDEEDENEEREEAKHESESPLPHLPSPSRACYNQCRIFAASQAPGRSSRAGLRGQRDKFRPIQLYSTEMVTSQRFPSRRRTCPASPRHLLAVGALLPWSRPPPPLHAPIPAIPRIPATGEPLKRNTLDLLSLSPHFS